MGYGYFFPQMEYWICSFSTFMRTVLAISVIWTFPEMGLTLNIPNSSILIVFFAYKSSISGSPYTETPSNWLWILDRQDAVPCGAEVAGALRDLVYIWGILGWDFPWFFGGVKHWSHHWGSAFYPSIDWSHHWISSSFPQLFILQDHLYCGWPLDFG